MRHHGRDEVTRQYLRFHHLKAMGVFDSRQSLMRAQQKAGFPKPIKINGRIALYLASEVKLWLAELAAARARSGIKKGPS